LNETEVEAMYLTLQWVESILD